MRRALPILAFLSLFAFAFAFLPGDVSSFISPCSTSLFPPFTAGGVKPNILIILDVSNSFDEDYYGNAVGSYSPISKSVTARQALQQIVTELEPNANVGLMTFTLPSDVSFYYVHNSTPFSSYNPATYCPNPNPAANPVWPPPDCQTYCATGDAAAQQSCQSQCQQANPNFSTNFTDVKLKLPPAGPYAFNEPTGARARYCSLAYPKFQKWQDATHPANSAFYFNQSDPFYDTGNDGIMYGYAGSDSPPHVPYSSAENAANEYTYCTGKTGTLDTWSGYSGSCANYEFVPTDSDWALGFFNWGQQMPWYYIGPTWFSSTSINNNNEPQGYLHVPVGDLTNSTQFDNIFNILAPNPDSSVPIPNNTPYMVCCPPNTPGCNAANKNTCAHLVNAANTPTAGTLQTALAYFNGQLKQNGTTYSSPITSPCQKNFIIFVTDGLPDTKLDGSLPTATTQYCYNATGSTNNQICSNTTSTCPSSYNWACATPVMAQVLQELDSLNSNVYQTFNNNSSQFPVQTYVLGLGLTNEAQAQLAAMAVHGGTQTSSGQAYYANAPQELYDALGAIVQNLFGSVSSGTSVSILSEGQTQNGSNMLQGVFYPSKSFGLASLTWAGYMYDYWFYTSPQYNNIREDTFHDYILELNEDYGLTFNFAPATGLTVNRYQDPLATGNPTTFVNTVGLDSLTPLWEAGKLLFQQTAASRQIYTPDATGTSATGLVSFDTNDGTLTTAPSPLGSTSNFDTCLNGSFQNLINYVRGTDIKYCSNGTSFNYQSCSQNSDCTTAPYTSCVNACRSRTIGLCSNGTSFNNTPCGSNNDCSGSYSTCTKNVWKLGDIVYSTPKVQTDYKYCSIPNSTTFNSQACAYDTDCTSGSYTSCQKKESVVFVGANDGMLHAFRTGILTTQGMDPTQHQVVGLTGIPDSAMGTELWSFIPKNSLPYLRCLAAPSGCHLYYNDLSPYITTMNASTTTTTMVNGTPVTTTTVTPKTILIGGMRLGGEAVASGTYCLNAAGVSNGTICTNVSTCPALYKSSCSSAYYLNAPSDTCSQSFNSNHASLCTVANPDTCYNPSNCTGLSSYYALDITDAENPKLLWEFSHPFLGYTYSGPAVIHEWTNPGALSGDQYYVMFLSGPTDPVDGSSIQDAYSFVLTLDNNLNISSVASKDLGIPNGFGGRLFNQGLDVDGNGSTDFVFFGYVANSITGSPKGGGIGKINTNGTNIAAWTYDLSTYSSANIAQLNLPITAQVATEQCFGSWYLYAGTGRYFFPQDNYGPAALNIIMGIPFTCHADNTGCTAISSLNNSAAVCADLGQHDTAGAAWEYTLNAASGVPGTPGSFLNERMYTDPTTTNSTSSATYNAIFFTSAQPTYDPCIYGGQSRLWGLNCATGAAITDTTCSGYTVSNPTGTMYMQTSTGAIYGFDIATGFNDPNTGNRTTPFKPGMAPENGPQGGGSPTAPARAGQLMQWIEK